jgi:type IV secretory pathway TrbL component
VGASNTNGNGNGTTIAKSQDPLEAFGVSIRGAGVMAGRRRSSDKGDGSGPFKVRAGREGIDERSFKQQFKHAYMTRE